MALTHTLAGLRTALDTFNTSYAAAVAAPGASTWATAWSDFGAYAATYNGLVAEGFTVGSGTAGSLPAPKDLLIVLQAAQSGVGGVRRDQRRLVRTSVRHSNLRAGT